MEQLKLQIAVGGESASSQKQGNDVVERVVRRAPRAERDAASPQLKFRLLVLQPMQLPAIEARPMTTDECERRHTWLPYCPHVSCQYHLLLDVVDKQGTVRAPFISSDDEFDMDAIPRIEESFDAALLEPEDRPSGAKPGDMVRALIPATCALRVAIVLDRQRDNRDEPVEYSAIGRLLDLSKERVRQIANDAYEKGRRARQRLIGDGQTIDDLFDS